MGGFRLRFAVLAACSVPLLAAVARGEDAASALWAPAVRAPMLEERALSCPVGDGGDESTFAFRGKPIAYKTSAQADYRSPHWESRIAKDFRALDGLVGDDTQAVIVDVRRVGGVPAYAYFGNGGTAHDVYEPWSASKFQAASAALARVRQESGGEVGGDARVGRVAVSDLVTALHSYGPSGDVTASSNAIGGYLLQVAGTDFASKLFGDGWLGLDDDASRFRSGYGAAPFEPESAPWVGPDGTAAAITPKRDAMNGDKLMSAFAQAEWLRRLALHEDEPDTRMPGLTSDDLEVLFYGADRNGEPGGMSAGVSTYLAQAIASASTADEARATLGRVAGPHWRIFSKVGWGDSSTRNRSEVVTVAYACLPELGGGRELVVAARTSLAGAPGVGAAGEAHLAALKSIVGALLRTE
jgi:hypothetical protein